MGRRRARRSCTTTTPANPTNTFVARSVPVTDTEYVVPDANGALGTNTAVFVAAAYDNAPGTTAFDGSWQRHRHRRRRHRLTERHHHRIRHRHPGVAAHRRRRHHRRCRQIRRRCRVEHDIDPVVRRSPRIRREPGRRTVPIDTVETVDARRQRVQRRIVDTGRRELTGCRGVVPERCEVRRERTSCSRSPPPAPRTEPAANHSRSHPRTSPSPTADPTSSTTSPCASPCSPHPCRTGHPSRSRSHPHGTSHRAPPNPNRSPPSPLVRPKTRRCGTGRRRARRSCTIHDTGEPTNAFVARSVPVTDTEYVVPDANGALGTNVAVFVAAAYDNAPAPPHSTDPATSPTPTPAPSTH